MFVIRLCLFVSFWNNISKVCHASRKFAASFTRNSCNWKFGEEGRDVCLATHLEVRICNFTSNALLETLIGIDGDHRIRHLYIDFHSPPKRDSIPEQQVVDCSREASATLDSFVTPRPWWMVVREATSSQSKLIRELFLVRARQTLENHLLLVSKVQFPPQHGCESSKLVLGHMVNSGWGSHMNLYGSYWGGNPFNVFNIWDSLTNMANESVVYASQTFCPTTVNKRLCAFLPLTNCTMPSMLTSVQGDKRIVLKALWPNGPNGFAIYTSATADGKLLLTNDRNAAKPTSQYHQQLYANISRSMAGRRFDSTALFIDGDGKELVGKEAVAPPITQNVVYSHGLIWRPNAVYRSLMKDRIERFRREAKFPDNIDCVAIHIRRGDRVHKNTNMTNFCRQHNAYTFDNCTTLDGRPKKCIDLLDKGCYARFAFGELTLQQYLDRAWQLHPTRNVFVLTDDEKWLNREKESIPAEWHVAALTARQRHRKHDSNLATANGVDFLASVALARQCQAFVGHMQSAVSTLVYHAMCMHHSNGMEVGRCPKACDFNRPQRKFPILGSARH